MKASDQGSSPSHFIVGYCIMLMQTSNPDVTPINTEHEKNYKFAWEKTRHQYLL